MGILKNEIMRTYNMRPSTAERCMEILEMIDSITKTEYERGFADGGKPTWITCSERLPEANGRYLVTRGLSACGALWNRVYIINYSDLMGIKSERIWWDGNVGKSDFQKINDIIAWRELPEPWRGEDNEKA